jgi:hypothetical protein
VRALVLVELIPEEVAISEPENVALNLRDFDRLGSVAIFGDEARVLLDQVADDMRRSET